MGIRVANPDINKSEADFVPRSDESTIYYGFTAINGFSKVGTKTILDNRPFETYTEFVEKYASTMNKTDMILLIKAGAFNNICGNDKMDLFKKLFLERFKNGQEDKKPIKKVNKTHIGQLLDDGMVTPEQSKDTDFCLAVINKNRKKEGWAEFKRKYCQGTEDDWTYEALSSYMGVDMFEGVPLPDFTKVNVKDTGIVGGIIMSIKKNTIKSGKMKGKQMAFINLDVRDNTFDLTVFPDAYSKYVDTLKEGKCIVATVNKDSDVAGVMSNCMTLEQYKERI